MEGIAYRCAIIEGATEARLGARAGGIGALEIRVRVGSENKSGTGRPSWPGSETVAFVESFVGLVVVSLASSIWSRLSKRVGVFHELYRPSRNGTLSFCRM